MSIERILIGFALVLGALVGYLVARSRSGNGDGSAHPVHQILLPFTGTAISTRAVDAALRLALAEDATLMPAYLATVPKRLPLECPIPAEAAKAMPMLETIEQRAAARRSPSTPGSSAVAPTGTRSSGCSNARASTGSSSRRPPPPAPASPAPTSSGCSRRLRPRC